MRYVFETIALFVAFAGLAWYSRRNLGGYREVPPQIFTKWPRSGRLAFVWTSMILLVLLFIPLAVTLIFVALDAESCNSVFSAAWACDAKLRVPAAVALFGFIGIAVLAGSTVLARIQNYGVDVDEY